MSVDYKISRFTLVEPLIDTGQIALFNSFTKGVGALPAQIWEEIQTGSVSHEATISQLVDQGFLVPAETNEELAFVHWRNQTIYDLTHLTYFINPTYGCNLKCFDCYFGQTEKMRRMNHETARSVLDFITIDLEQKRPLSVRLDFGVPDATLDPEIILYLIEGLHRFCRGRRILFKTTLTSHGLDIEPNLIEALKKFGLSKIRIKIGGPSIVHDQLRPTKEGTPTFEKIMSNLEKIAGLTEMHLICHYDPIHEDHLLLTTLLNDLLIHGLKEYITSVKFHPILPVHKKEELNPRRAGWIDCLPDVDPKRYAWLEDQIRTWGFFVPDEPPSCDCLTNRRSTMVIDIEGNIKVCPFQIDNPELYYGHVKTGIDFYRESRWLARELPKQCRQDCAIAPICNGGCHYLGFLETGAIDGIHCMYESLERLIRDYIRRTIQRYKSERMSWSPEYTGFSTILRK